MSVVIHHNPDCGTSRNVLAIIKASGVEPVVIPYLDTGWTRGQLLGLFAAAGLTPRSALRVKRSPAEALGLLNPDVGDEALRCRETLRKGTKTKSKKQGWQLASKTCSEGVCVAVWYQKRLITATSLLPPVDSRTREAKKAPRTPDSANETTLRTTSVSNKAFKVFDLRRVKYIAKRVKTLLDAVTKRASAHRPHTRHTLPRPPHSRCRPSGR